MVRLERTDKPISVLVDELKSGTLGLPEIQRTYEWNPSQTRDLLDSLYHQYPIGLILEWKPKELPELRDTHLQENRNSHPDYLILDGQQRLTSLAKVFAGEIDVWFNVEEQSFQIFSRKLQSNPLWISVKKVLDEGGVKSWLELKNLVTVDEAKVNEYLERLSNLEKIKDYRIPVMIIHTDDYNEVTESFIRVNSKGTRLKEAELAMARLALHWPGALVNQFERALNEYEAARYELEATFLMRCYVAVATGQSRFKYLGSLWKKPEGQLKEFWERTKNAVDHTINFVRNNAGIESTDWIPSVNALVPMVAFLARKNGQLTDAETKGLLFWYLEATIQGRFSSSPETNIDQDLKAIQETDAVGALIANLKKDVASLEITEEMMVGKYQTHPILPLVFILSRQRSSKDWFTGTVLSSTNVGGQHQLELHHIFPKAVLRDDGSFESKEIDDLANIAFLSQKANRTILRSNPFDYLSKIEAQRLAAQFVPLDRELWKVMNYRKFLTTRRKALTDEINSFLKELGMRYFSETPVSRFSAG
jgi:hypothetical protein